MKRLKRFTCFTLTLSLLFSDNYLTGLAGIDFAKPITAAAATITDCYAAYDKLIETMKSGGDFAEQLNLNKIDGVDKTRITTAGDEESPDIADLWALNKTGLPSGIYKNYFTYEQKNMDATAQVKSGKWLQDSQYEAMAGTPTTERLFVTMGASQWIVDLQYRFVETQYLRRYTFDAGCKNYMYYKWGPVTGGDASERFEHTTEMWAYDLNPEPMTFKNAGFRYNEGYFVDKKHYGDQYQFGDGKTQILSGGKKVPTKDQFHTGGQALHHDLALSNSMSPNRYTAIAVKKYLYQAIEQFRDGFDAQDDNYRADQGLSDPAYDEYGGVSYYRQIGWNYTYYFMARKSYNASHGITNIEGTGASQGQSWAANAWRPVFITYMYDWQSYHRAGGLDTSYPSATLVFPKVGNWISRDELWQAMDVYTVAHGAPSARVMAQFPFNLNYMSALAALGADSNALADWGNPNVSLLWTLQLICTSAHASSLADWIFFDKQTFLDNVCEFGVQSKSYGMKLDPSMVGSAVSMTYINGTDGETINLVDYGFNSCATLYMYAMYYIFLNYGPMFYTSELQELFQDCHWYKPNPQWTDEKANEALGHLFGATTVDEYNTNVSLLSGMSCKIPLAAFPRGGDLDSSADWGNQYGGTLERGAIDNYDERDLLTLQADVPHQFVYSYNINISITQLRAYSYGKDYCIAYHGDGTHCTTSWMECVGQPHVHHSPAPTGTDDHGKAYTSGCTAQIEYYTVDELNDNCGMPCSSCEHDGDCPEYDGEDPETGEKIDHSHTEHTKHKHSAQREHHDDHHKHYVGEDGRHDSTYPTNKHDDHCFTEEADVDVTISVNKQQGHFVESPKSMGYHDDFGQLFTNVQWLDVTSYQVWMLNSGYSKGLASILASPVTVDKDHKILQTAIVSQKGVELYNIDDPDNTEPVNGMAKLRNIRKNLQATGRVANSFNVGSYGNVGDESKFMLEIPNKSGTATLRAATLAYWANDVPATRGITLWDSARNEVRFRDSTNFVNGDAHAFYITACGDTVKFQYNPYSQGGRSHCSFYGFINQALAHTLYYPASSDKVSPNKHPTRGNSYWVSYSNSLRIQGDYIGMDFLEKQQHEQQTLAGYMYDTWDEKDVDGGCIGITHGHKFKLLKDSEDGYTEIAKYNIRCSWVPGKFGYLLSRAPNDVIYGSAAQSIITCTNNCFMIHTFCRGINDNKHTCWDSIAGDSGGANCVFGSATEMGTVTAVHSNPNIQAALPNPHSGDNIIVTLKYWDGKTPYQHAIDTLKTKEYYNHKYMYVCKGDSAPYVGYGADNKGKDGTHDITKNGGKNTQRGYNNSHDYIVYDVQQTMVSTNPFINNGKQTSFKRFGVTVKDSNKPKHLNGGKEDQGKVAKTLKGNANSWSKWYPWLQDLDLNRYLANDRYTTGSAQAEYLSVAKFKDVGQKGTLYAHTENRDADLLKKYYYKLEPCDHVIPKDFTGEKCIYLNAAYRPEKQLEGIDNGEENFYGNPNDIVIYNPVSTESAHVVPVSEHLPDGSNVGTVSKGGIVKRSYTESYLKSFLTYVKRDSRLAYKYDLTEAIGDDHTKTEHSVNLGSVFVAHNTTMKTEVVEEYKEVSDVVTESHVATDYTTDMAELIRHMLNNGNTKVTITQSGKYNLQYLGSTTTQTTEMSEVDLESGDELEYDTEHGMLYLNMVKKYSVDFASLVYMSNVLAVIDSGKFTTLLNRTDSYVDKLTIPEVVREDVISTVKTIMEVWFNNSGYLSSHTDVAMEAVNDYLTSMNFEDVGYTAEQVQSVVNKMTSDFASTVSSIVKPDNYTGPIGIEKGTTGQLIFSSSGTMRAGETILLKLRTNNNLTPSDLVCTLSQDGNKLFNTRTVYSPNGEYATGTLNIYIEALEDDVVLSSIDMVFNKDTTLTDISCETVKIPLLTDVPVKDGVLDMDTIGYYCDGNSWSITSAGKVQAKNKYIVKTCTKTAFKLSVINTFVLEMEGHVEAGVKIKGQSVSAHTVISSYWKNYVLGWRANGTTITSQADSLLNDPNTILTAPSGTKITVGDLLQKLRLQQLYIYQTNDTYKLALASDKQYWDSEKLNYYIESSFYTTVDKLCFMSLSDKHIGELTIDTTVHNLYWYQHTNIETLTSLYLVCIYVATDDSTAIAYDVQRSSNDDHKYTPEDGNYELDVREVTRSYQVFTEEAYKKVFGEYLSLDDEFTLYWDNFANLVTDEEGKGENGTHSNVKKTKTSLGRGWDNVEDSVTNIDDGSDEKKNSSRYFVRKNSDGDWVSTWNDFRKLSDYWREKKNSKKLTVTDCTKWIYTKYVIFNVDMYAFTEGDSYVYDDTDVFNADGTTKHKWDPTTPAYKEDGKPNNIVYIPAGQHVYLGYYLPRIASEDFYGSADDNGRFVDFGYNVYINKNGNLKRPNATADKKDVYTKDPNGDLYTYHFWVPLSDGESDSAVTVQYVVNSINSVGDCIADANNDNRVSTAEAKRATDTSDSLGSNVGSVKLSRNKDVEKAKYFVTKGLKDMSSDRKQTTASSSAIQRNALTDEWGGEVIDASGVTLDNNSSVIKMVSVNKNEDGVSLFHMNTDTKAYRRYNNSVNSSTVSVIGSIGGFTVMDVGDPRYQDTFKTALESDSPKEWFLYPIVRLIKKYSNKKGEHGSQNMYLADYLDVRGRYMIKDENVKDMLDYKLVKSGDTYSWNDTDETPLGSAVWYLKDMTKRFSTETTVPNIHDEIKNDNQSVKVGYEQLCSVETIGNYFGSRDKRAKSQETVNINDDYGQTKLQVVPIYYAYNTRTGETVNVDVYMKSGNTYKCINAGSEFATSSAAIKQKKIDEESGVTITEEHYYDGPYYLDNAYDNAYTYSIVPNTEQPNEGSVDYDLDQNMLRFSITERESAITFDVVRKWIMERNHEVLKNSITTTLLENFDYSNNDMIGGKALDSSYAYGNAQILYLREFNRTFIGGTTDALKEKLPTDSSPQFVKDIIRNAGMYAQKWYFGIKLPSSTIFVRHGYKLTYHKVTKNGYTYTMTTTDLSHEQDWVIYCRLTIYAIGDKYILLTHSKPSLDPDPEDPGDPGDPKNPPSTKITTITINLNKQKSTVDLEGRGTH